MTVMILPKGMRRFFRTSNHIERLNKELKRRAAVIGVFPNEDSLLRHSFRNSQGNLFEVLTHP